MIISHLYMCEQMFDGKTERENEEDTDPMRQTQHQIREESNPDQRTHQSQHKILP